MLCPVTFSPQLVVFTHLFITHIQSLSPLSPSPTPPLSLPLRGFTSTQHAQTVAQATTSCTSLRSQLRGGEIEEGGGCKPATANSSPPKTSLLVYWRWQWEVSSTRWFNVSCRQLLSSYFRIDWLRKQENMLLSFLKGNWPSFFCVYSSLKG